MRTTYPRASHHRPRRYRGLTIDIHAHWYPQEWLTLFEKDGAKYGTRIERSADGYNLSTGKIANRFTDEFVSIDLRLQAMDRQGVDVHALSLTTPMVYFAEPAFGLALAQSYNDACAAAHQQHPKRFYGLAQLPMQDSALALKELERAATLPGMRGLYMATNVNGIDLDDKRFWDVYAKVEELGWTIFLHPVDTVGKERMAKFHMRNLLGNPYDTGIAAAYLIFGGVLDAFPRLGFNLPHAGGTMPGLIGRWDHGTKMRDELKHMKQLPSAYLRRFTYDTIGHNDTINLNLVRLVGADRVTLGSDYCFDMGLEHPHDTVESLTAIGDADRDLILGGNAERLLAIG
jgi:aminocarboxymuconate-semialdehyde decarboxylase